VFDVFSKSCRFLFFLAIQNHAGVAGLKQTIGTWAKDLGLQRSKACLMGGRAHGIATALQQHCSSIAAAL